MNINLKAILGLFGLIAIAISGCDSDTTSTPDNAGTVTPYPFAVIVDISTDENTDGTAGADICGVVAECEGEVRYGVISAFEVGGGAICGQTDEEIPACGANGTANDPTQGIDDGAQCTLEFDPETGAANYVSLGMGGTLILDFSGDLQGCSLSVIEHAGDDTEGYSVKLCAALDNGGADLSRCVSEQRATEGGSTTTLIPEGVPSTGNGGSGGAGASMGAGGSGGSGASMGSGGTGGSPTPEMTLGTEGADLEIEGNLDEGEPVAIRGEVESGPFEFEGSGTAERASPDAPVTWCVSGMTTLDTPLFTLDGLTVNVCRDANAVVVTTFEGTLTIEGLTAPVTGTLTDGEMWRLDMQSDLPLFGLPSSTLELGYAQGAEALTVEGNVSIAPSAPVGIVGMFTPGADVDLALVNPQTTPWAPLNDMPVLAFDTFMGQLTRVDGTLAGSFSASHSSAIEVDGLSLDSATAAGTLNNDGTWTVRIDGEGTIPPVGTASLSGMYDADGQRICLSGASTLMLPDSTSDMNQTVCLKDNGVERLSFTGQADIEPMGLVDLEGTYDAEADLLCLQGASTMVFPGSTSPFNPRICLTNGAQDLLPTEFHARAELPPIGVVELHGIYDAETSTLCMNGSSEFAFPGTETVMNATACVDLSDPTNPQLSSVDFDASVSLEPIGPIDLVGQFDSDAQTLCLSGESSIAIPGAETGLEASVCIDFTEPLSPTLSEVTFSGTTAVPPLGEFSVSGEFNGPENELCLTGATTIMVPDSDAVLMASTCLDLSTQPPTLSEVTFAAEMALPPAAALVSVSGSITGDELCLTGATDLTPPGADVALSGKVCLDITGPTPVVNTVEFSGESEVEPFGVVSLSGEYADAQLCLEGSIEGDTSAWLPIPDVVIHDVVAQTCFSEDNFDSVALRTTFTVGNGNAAITLQSVGAYTANGPVEMGLSLAPGCGTEEMCGAYESGCETPCDGAWTPFADIGGAPDNLRDLGFSPLSGTLTKEGNVVTIEASAGLMFDGGDGSLDIIPNVFTLREVSADVSLASSGEFSVSLAGRSTLDVAGTDLDMRVSTAVTNEDLTFTGSINVEDGIVLDPMKDLIGEGVLAVQPNGGRVTIQTNFAARTIMFDLQTTSTLELGLLNLSVTPLIAVRTEFGGGRPAITLVGTISELEVAFFDDTMDLAQAGAVVIAASTENIEGYEIDGDGDPETPGVTYDIPKGLTLIAQGELTPLAAILEPGTDLNAEIMINVKSPQNLEITASINSNFKLIRPEFGIPSLKSLSTDSLGVKLKIQAANQEIELFGTMVAVTTTNPTELNPNGVESVITGRGVFSVDRNLVIGGSVALEGDWKEPLRLPKVAINNPGFGLKLRINPELSGIPVPTAFKINGDLIFLREGYEWPANIETDGTGSPIIPIDDVTGEKTLVTGGGTLVLDIIPTESGVCVVGACLPLPTMIFRVNLENLQMTDLLSLEQRIRTGTLKLAADVAGLATRDPFAAIIPQDARDALGQVSTVLMPSDAELETPNFEPFELNLNKLLVYFSTHEITEFGADFTPGMRMELDANAQLPPDYENREVKLLGAVSPDGLILSGLMSGIDLEMGPVARFTLAGDPFQKYAQLGQGHIEVPHHLDLASPRTIEGWVNTDQIPAVLTDGVIAEKWAPGSGGYGLYIGTEQPSCDRDQLPPSQQDNPDACAPKGVVSMMISDGNTDRFITSNFGQIATGAWHHIAATIQPVDGNVAIFVDGKQVPSTESDIGNRFPINPNNTASLMMGHNLTRVDDVRLWANVRDASQIAGQARVLPIEYNQTEAPFEENPLIAQYMFNYDDTSDQTDRFYDVAQQAYIAHNTRLYPQGASALHGYFRDGSTPEVNMQNNDLYTKLALLLTDPLASGLWVKSGMAIDTVYDPLDRAYSTETNFSAGGAASSTYSRAFTLLPLGPLGEFMLSGNGPNLRKGDFDDGFYAAFDLAAQPFATMATTGALLFKSPNGSTQDISASNMWFRCPTVQCASVQDYVFHSSGGINLLVALPDNLGNLGITGSHIFDSKTDTGGARFAVDGSVQAFGKTLSSGSIFMDDQRLKLTSSLSVGMIQGIDLGTASSMAMELVYAPKPRMCGESQTDLAVPGLTTFNGTLKVCLGHDPSTYFSANGSINLGGFTLSSTDVCLSQNDTRGCGTPAGDGLRLSTQLSLPGDLINSSLNGYYKNAADFSLQGSGTVTVANQQLSSTSITVNSNSGAYVTGDIGIPTFGSSAVDGFIRPVGINLYDYSLTGNSNLSPFGLTLSNSSITVTPPSMRVSGSLDLLIGSSNVDATVDAFTGDFRSESNATLAVAGLTLSESRLILTPQSAAITSATYIGATRIGLNGTVSGAGGVNLSGSSTTSISVSSPDVCATTPRVCTPNCVDVPLIGNVCTGFGEVCIGGDRFCEAGIHFGSLTATITATVNESNGTLSSSASGNIGGASLSGSSSISVNPPQVCQRINFPCVDLGDILGCVGVPSQDICVAL